ncbi:class I SAM-dependent methyltransferase [Bacillus sp. RG28]|uniref:Class I SAM-dependent methyltransferase n=1 Tax=Gottfriedia endophytica TaxID=2820819 RepID=A0A940SHQ8_9BACI|nr:class I SAM-dependent methyltransferase [Gottfriedia endophytica]MBP0723751.1 class I SAM-dependent methyltransferase [Gottfriedia endophytica]
MTYNRFATLYDGLMQDVPYDSWLKFLEDAFRDLGLTNPSIVDIGCGTGTLPILLAKKGYSVTGIDLSEEMLSMAMEKAEQEKVTIPFYMQNMMELEGFENIDCISILCDSLNYLQSEEEVAMTFQKVHESLKSGGLFIFDVHSIYKIKEIFANETFFIDDENLSLVWNCSQGEEDYSVEHDLVFFMRDEESDLYERFEEYHIQTTFPVKTYEKLLKEAGFQIKKISADFNQTVQENSERIFFIAQKM